MSKFRELVTTKNKLINEDKKINKKIEEIDKTLHKIYKQEVLDLKEEIGKIFEIRYNTGSSILFYSYFPEINKRIEVYIAYDKNRCDARIEIFKISDCQYKKLYKSGIITKKQQEKITNRIDKAYEKAKEKIDILLQGYI